MSAGPEGKPWPPLERVDYWERAWSALGDLPLDYRLPNTLGSRPLLVRHLVDDLSAGRVSAAQVFAALSVRRMLRPTARSEQP